MVAVHTRAETIQGRKLFKRGNYMRKYGKFPKISMYLDLDSTILFWKKTKIFLETFSYHEKATKNRAHVWFCTSSLRTPDASAADSAWSQNILVKDNFWHKTKLVLQ